MGAEQGAISHGTVAYEPRHDRRSGRGLVRVPATRRGIFVGMAAFIVRQRHAGSAVAMIGIGGLVRTGGNWGLAAMSISAAPAPFSITEVR